MCIILTCEQGVRPDYDLIDTCFTNNPDGAGVMWVEDGRVQISKGYSDAKSLMELINYIPNNSRMVIHMRIATSGGIDVGTCHPFPICDRLEALHAPDVECDAALAHNGIIATMPTDNKLGISDTISFVQLIVNDLYLNEGLTKSSLRRIKLCAPGNRFAIMTSDGTVHRLGVGWETVTKGIQASNESWRWKIWSKGYLNNYKSYYSSDWWNDDYDDDWGYYYGDEYASIFEQNCSGCMEKSNCMATEPYCQTVKKLVNEWYDADEYTGRATSAEWTLA